MTDPTAALQFPKEHDSMMTPYFDSRLLAAPPHQVLVDTDRLYVQANMLKRLCTERL